MQVWCWNTKYFTILVNFFVPPLSTSWPLVLCHQQDTIYSHAVSKKFQNFTLSRAWSRVHFGQWSISWYDTRFTIFYYHYSYKTKKQNKNKVINMLFTLSRTFELWHGINMNEESQRGLRKPREQSEANLYSAVKWIIISLGINIAYKSDNCNIFSVVTINQLALRRKIILQLFFIG